MISVSENGKHELFRLTYKTVMMQNTPDIFVSGVFFLTKCFCGKPGAAADDKLKFSTFLPIADQSYHRL